MDGSRLDEAGIGTPWFIPELAECSLARYETRERASIEESADQGPLKIGMFMYASFGL